MDMDSQLAPQRPTTSPHHFYEHPLYSVPYLRIEVDKGHIHDQPATEYDKERFAPAWAAFETGDDQSSGIRLETQGWIEPLLLPLFQKSGLLTVEQLANATDPQLQRLNLPGVHAMAEKARKVVSEQESLGETADLKRRLEALEAELAEKKAEAAPAPAPADSMAKARAAKAAKAATRM